MFRPRLALVTAIVVGAAVLPGSAHAQYGGSGMGSALSSDPMSHQGKVQAGVGLFTGVVVFSAAFGGLFALAFALAHGRIGDFGPRAVSALLATLGFISVSVVPHLKYPASPPSIGVVSSSRSAPHFGIPAAILQASARSE